MLTSLCITARTQNTPNEPQLRGNFMRKGECRGAATTLELSACTEGWPVNIGGKRPVRFRATHRGKLPLVHPGGQGI